MMSHMCYMIPDSVNMSVCFVRVAKGGLKYLRIIM